MASTKDQADAAIKDIGGESAEWPAYIALGRALPVPFRPLAAAAAILDVGDDPAFAACLIANFRAQVPFIAIDDLRRFPPANEKETFRSVIRSWLMDVEVDTLLNELDERDESEMSRLLFEAMRVRSALENGPNVPAMQSRHESPLLRQLHKRAITVARPLAAAAEPPQMTLEGVSPFLAATWAKYVGDRALLSSARELARVAYTHALERTSQLPASPVKEELSATLKLSRIGAGFPENLFEPDVLSDLPVEAAPGRSARVHQLFDWTRAVVTGEFATRNVVSPTSALGSADIDLDVHGANSACFSALLGYEEGPQRELDEDLERHVGRGHWFLTPHFVVRRAALKLEQSEPDTVSALFDLVSAADANGPRLIDRVPASSLRRSLEGAGPEWPRQLLAAAEREPPLALVRRAIVSSLLRAIAKNGAFPVESNSSAWEVLLNLGGQNFHGSLSNTDAMSPALEALTWIWSTSRRLLPPDAWRNAVGLAKTTLFRENAWWLGQERSLDLLDAVAQSEEEATPLIAQIALDFGDLLTNRSAIRFPLDHAFLRLLGRPMVLAAIGADPALRERAATFVTRTLSTGTSPHEWNLAWQYAFFIARQLRLELPPGAQLVIDTMLDQTKSVTSAVAPAAVRTLLRHIDGLDANEVRTVLGNLVVQIDFRPPDKRVRPSAREIADAVREVCGRDRELSRVLGEPPAKFIAPIAEASLRYVTDSLTQPNLLGRFAIPIDEEPVPATAWAWTLAALTTASRIGRQEDVRVAAERLSALSPGVAQAVARALSDAMALDLVTPEFNERTIATLDANAFEGALPAQLAHAVEQNDALSLHTIVERTLRTGPRNADVGVLAAAVAFADKMPPSVALIDEYFQRLARNAHTMDTGAVTMASRLLEAFRRKAARET